MSLRTRRSSARLSFDWGLTGSREFQTRKPWTAHTHGHGSGFAFCLFSLSYDLLLEVFVFFFLLLLSFPDGGWFRAMLHGIPVLSMAMGREKFVFACRVRCHIGQ